MKFTLQAIGYLGHDAQVINHNNQDGISFSVAVTKKYHDRAGNLITTTTWVNCIIWRKTGDTKLSEYLKKGTQVYIEGEPSIRAYTTKAGEPAASMDCRVNVVELLGRSPKTEPGNVQSSQNNNEDDLPF